MRPSLVRFLRPVGSGLLLLILWLGAAVAEEPSFPALTGRVVDQADILSPDTEARLTALLQDYEAQTSHQVVVVTLESLQGLTIEDFGVRLGRHWAIGQAGEDNGVLLIVAPLEREVRIEVGYGLEATLTDALSRSIIEQNIVPYFKDGDWDGGVSAGTLAILTVLSPKTLGEAGDKAPSPAPEEDNLLAWLLGSGAFLLLNVFLQRRLGWAGLFSLYGHLMVSLLLSGRGGGRGGSGGFSGGGGSFGGGGASGRW